MPWTAAQRLGYQGERLAARYFQQRGFQLQAQHYRYQRSEIDLIVRKARLLVFVEVKTRRTLAWGFPEEAVGARKRHALQKVAAHYLEQVGWEYPIRFDILAVEMRPPAPRLVHFEDAF